MILDVDERRLIADDGRSLRLTGQEAILVTMLADGGVVCYDRLICAIWGDDEPEDANNAISILACRLRRKLIVGRFPPLICTVRCVGFKLSEPLAVRRAGPAPVTIPAEHRATFRRLMLSHPDHSAADRVLASIVGG